MCQNYRARICKSLRSPGIDSEESIPPAYEFWRVGTTNGIVVQARQAGNRFLGSLQGLQIRAQYTCRHLRTLTHFAQNLCTLYIKQSFRIAEKYSIHASIYWSSHMYQ
jgi:hypothetical protein